MANTTSKVQQKKKSGCTCSHCLEPCTNHEHEFMVVRWDKRGIQNEAAWVRCKFCLLKIELGVVEPCEAIEKTRKAREKHL